MVGRLVGWLAGCQCTGAVARGDNSGMFLSLMFVRVPIPQASKRLSVESSCINTI